MRSRASHLRVPWFKMNTCVQQHMQELVADFQQRLPSNRRVLRLKDLYLPLVLRDFGLDHTRSYLLTFGEQRDTQTFAQDDMLVQTIDRVTHGTSTLPCPCC